MPNNTVESPLKTYKKQRGSMYPSIEDQLDMLYWDKKNGTNGWVEFIDTVKETNPKPPELDYPEETVTEE